MDSGKWKAETGKWKAESGKWKADLTQILLSNSRKQLFSVQN